MYLLEKQTSVFVCLECVKDFTNNRSLAPNNMR